MRLLTKIGIGVFLCLSLFMVACSIIRATGTYYKNALDYPWQVFWLHSEACIGMIMASITVYRSTLVGSNEVSDRMQSFFRRLCRLHSTKEDSPAIKMDPPSQPRPQKVSLKIPRPTLTGLRTMFGNGTTTFPTTAATISTMDSEHGLVDTDYHAHIRAQATTKSGNTSREDTKSG